MAGDGAGRQRSRRLLAIGGVGVILAGAGVAGGILAAKRSGNTPKRSHRAATVQTTSSSTPATTTPSSATSASSAPAGASGLEGYLASLTNGAVFIQWTEVGGAVTGSAEAVYLNGATTNVEHETVTGDIEGSSLTLSVDPDGLYGTSNLSGQFQGSGFVLSIPNNDGALVPVTFDPGTAADFDSDVAALDGQATKTSNAQAAAAAQQQAAANLQQQEQTAQQDAGTVASDIAGLPSDVSSVSSDVASMKGDLASEAGDLTTTEQQAATVEAEAKQSPAGDSGEVCGDAGTAEGDAGTVSGDAGTVEGDAGTVEGDIGSENNDATTLETDWQNYLAALPAGYVVPNAPTEADVTKALKSAAGAIAQLVAQANTLIDQANADVNAAYNAANTAFSAGNCGSPESLPTPVTTIPS